MGGGGGVGQRLGGRWGGGREEERGRGEREKKRGEFVKVLSAFFFLHTLDNLIYSSD